MSDATPQYGFFCDIETAVIHEYDKAEYYVKTTRTSYEVRRKIPIKSTLSTLPEEDLEDPEEDDKSKSCFSEKDQGCFSVAFHSLCRIPRDLYYMVFVCTVATSCVVFVMNYEHDTNK
jgi:hypothetical protein